MWLRVGGASTDCMLLSICRSIVQSYICIYTETLTRVVAAAILFIHGAPLQKKKKINATLVY